MPCVYLPRPPPAGQLSLEEQSVGSSPEQSAQVSTGRVRTPELVSVQENIRSAAAQWRLVGCKGDFAAFDLCLLIRIAGWPQTRTPGVRLCEAS